MLTNQAGDPVALEARHGARARVEDAIRVAKSTGLSNLPFREFAHNAVWLELVLIAQDLIAWGQSVLLDGELARREPKRLRLSAVARRRADQPLGSGARASICPRAGRGRPSSCAPPRACRSG